MAIIPFFIQITAVNKEKMQVYMTIKVLTNLTSSLVNYFNNFSF